MTSTSPYQFSLQPNGFGVNILCVRDELRMEFGGEMPGVPDLDILLAPIDATHWDSGQEILRDEQRMILDHLRRWLIEKKIRSDLDRPTEQIDESERCIASGCNDPVLTGSFYCGIHFDETRLEK